MYHLFLSFHSFFVFLIMVLSLVVLSKTADYFVNQSIKFTELFRMNELVAGATIVSFGTTLPEFSTVVISALGGNSAFAIGNSIGSIITNTSLILGMGTLFGRIPVDTRTTKKLYILIGVVMLMILSSLPNRIHNECGRIPQWIGIVFFVLFIFYMYYMIKWDGRDSATASAQTDQALAIGRGVAILFSILLSAGIVACSAAALVASAEVAAERIGIPDVIISSTLIAFGTSVPELSTCISAVKSGHGSLAIGNILGANVLNILFVIGVSAALSPEGLSVADGFYKMQFRWAMVLLLLLGFFAFNRKVHEISKKEGISLVLFYAAYMLVSFLGVK